MTIAAQLPKSTLDIRGDRLRFQLANAINECEAQYRRGPFDKATNTIALLNAVIAKLTPLTITSAIVISNISTDNSVTAAEAAAAIPVAGTTVNFANGTAVVILMDGVQVASGTISANAYSVSVASPVWLGLSIGNHTVTVKATDSAGILRTQVRTVARTA